MGTAAIGLFDSGWGGLSIALAVRAALQAHPLLYVGDHAWCPYGRLAPGAIEHRSLAMAGVLVDRGSRVVVVACNTASATALDAVRRAFPGVPVVGVVPAVKPAAAASRSNRIAVLATAATAHSPYLAALIADHATGATVDVVAASRLVGYVERGETRGPAIERVLGELLGPSLARGADAVVLGCTHFPFLREALRRVCGSGVALIDSGDAVARQVRRVAPPAAPSDVPPRFDLLTTGDPGLAETAAAILLGETRPVDRAEVQPRSARLAAG